MFEKIIKFQTSDKVRRENSDIIIYNNSSIEKYVKKIDNILKKIV